MSEGNTLLVRFRPGVSDTELKKFLGSYNCEFGGRICGFYEVTPPNGINVGVFQTELYNSGRGLIEYIELPISFKPVA